MTAEISPEFAELLIRNFNTPNEMPVHVLFNQWWKHAPEETKEKYLEDFRSIPEQQAWVSSDYYSDPLDLEQLNELPIGTVGKTFHAWIVENNLEPQISMNYRAFHKMLEDGGQLDGMPMECKYAILRGFQTHDFQHVITGYSSDGVSEIKLQAFCLAQIRFPYFGMWMSNVTTRMTYIDPTGIVPLMDAISEGWKLGRSIKNIQFVEWEKRLEEPLADVRREFNLQPQGQHPLAA